MVSINSKGYNLAEVEISTKLVVGASTEIGDAGVVAALKTFADSGIMRIKAQIEMSGVDIDFDGTVGCNLCTNGFEFHTVTYYSDQVTGGDPIIIGGQIYVDGAKTKVHLTAQTVS